MVERVRCTYCGKVSYTSSPRFANKCSYCSKPFVELQSKGARRDKGRDDNKRKSRAT